MGPGPMTDSPAAPATPAPGYSLWTPNHVALATFLGTPLAGGFLLSRSLRKLGRGGQAWGVIAGSVVATAALVAIGMAIPGKGGTFGLPVASVIGMRTWAQSALGPALAEHQKAGGRTSSGWAAAGIGLAGLVLFFGAFAAAVLVGPAGLRGGLTDCATMEGGDEVCFEDGGTREDATAVGKALVALDMHPGKALSVKVSRADAKLAVWFVVKEGAWDQDEVVKAFTAIGKELRNATFPKDKFEVRLADDSWNSHRSIVIE